MVSIIHEQEYSIRRINVDIRSAAAHVREGVGVMVQMPKRKEASMDYWLSEKKGQGATKLLSLLFAFILAFAWVSVPQSGYADPLPDGTQVAGLTDTLSVSSASASYTQAQGYEPYIGWQGTPWYDDLDPFYNSTGGAQHRAAHSCWSIVSPLSIGVTGYEGGQVITGSDVQVITDTNKTRTGSAGLLILDTITATYDHPDYYKNIILPPVEEDIAGGYTFKFNYVGPGGVTTNYASGEHIDKTPEGFPTGARAGGFTITTTDDPSVWSSDPSTIVWRADSTDISTERCASNWWQNVTIKVPDSVELDPSTTYYMVINNGTAGLWGRMWADVVFEFTTDTTAVRTWSGDISKTANYAAQGDGSVKVGIISPDAKDITVNLSYLNSCYYNIATKSLPQNDEGDVTVRLYSDGSGSNWVNSLLYWINSAGFIVYDQNPVSNGTYDDSALTPVVSSALGNISYSIPDPVAAAEWKAWDEGGRSGAEPITTFGYTGVDVNLGGLTAGQTYYFVVPQGFKFQNAQGPMIKPIVLQFKVAGGAEPQEMYRLYNPNSGEHFYTASSYERDATVNAGWIYEGIGWTAPSASESPVYRLYSGTDHHYTMSTVERDALLDAGWTYEGVGWYSDDDQGVPLYRQFNPFVNPSAPTNNSGSHNYTTDYGEHQTLCSIGWNDEGVAWYGMR